VAARSGSIPPPLDRLTYADAMRRYGSDKPDLRFGLELVDVAELFRGSDFRLFATRSRNAGQPHRRTALSGRRGALAARLRRADRTRARQFGAKGLPYITLDGRRRQGFDREVSPTTSSPNCASATGAHRRRRAPVRRRRRTRRATSPGAAARNRRSAGLRDPAAFAFCWVYRLPALRARCRDTGEITFSHHPFTAPAPGQEALFDTDPLASRAQHYDLVLNGFELGSGSIRNHKEAFQRKVFHRLGLDDARSRTASDSSWRRYATARRRTAGWRWAWTASRCSPAAKPNIRDVIAFPKNQAFRDVMMSPRLQ
jgi:aspartyl-tRNA synthetase